MTGTITNQKKKKKKSILTCLVRTYCFRESHLHTPRQAVACLARILLYCQASPGFQTGIPRKHITWPQLPRPTRRGDCDLPSKGSYLYRGVQLTCTRGGVS